MTGFESKREAAANKLQEPVNLLEARRIAAEYGTPDSQVDDGNLYFALSKCLEHIDAQPAQESYDQTALELCNVCGWKTLIPDDGCLNCERAQPAQPAQEPVAFAGIEMWVGGARIIKHLTQTELHYARDPWMLMQYSAELCLAKLKERNHGT